jgi:hypothetical protein
VRRPHYEHNHNPVSVSLSAYEDAGGHRLLRLAKVLAHVLENGREGCVDGMEDDLVSLHDHKGTLEVRSLRRLNLSTENWIRRAWAEIGLEPEEDVEFVWGKR